METKMMKFRGYDKVNKELYNSVGFIDFTNKTCQLGRIDFEGNYYPEEKKKFEDIILLRSTGKFDASGCEIFEGDIVQDDEVNYVVEWDKEDAMFTIVTSLVSMNFSDIDSKWLEIVGNKFEKKHLINNLSNINDEVDRDA